MDSKLTEQENVDKLAFEMFNEHYKKSVIYSLFILVFFSNVLINIDHGTLPSSTP